MKLPIKKIEEVTGYKVKRDFTSVGLDWATRTGIGIIKTTKKVVNINYMFIEFKSEDKKEKYKIMVNTLENLLNNENIVVIEDIHVQFKGQSLELAKYHGLTLSACIRKNIEYQTVGATTARSKLGISTTKKSGYGKGLAKKAVSDYLKNNFDIDLMGDDDASDGVILALLGILDGLDFRSNAEIKKEK